MIKDKKVLCIVTARKNSKGLKNKNLKKYKVRVNVLSPGGGDKHSQKFYNNYGKHTLFKKMLLPKDLNDIVCFLISEKSKNITGQEIIIDSGFVL